MSHIHIDDPPLDQADAEIVETKTARIENETDEFSEEFNPTSVTDLDPDSMYEPDGQRYIESFSTYIMNEKRPVQWVSQNGR